MAAKTAATTQVSHSIQIGVIGFGRTGGNIVRRPIEEAVSADVLSAALYARFRSRREHTFAEKVLSAMRKGFGGHVEPGTQRR
jgi:6-phosphogluconate dehydrogenase